MEALLQRICVELVVSTTFASTLPAAPRVAVLAQALQIAWQALRDPDCQPLLGPCVPGATLPLGARVPGTSLELDPPGAAFNLGAMLDGPAGGVGGLLAMLLPAADYAARRAPYDGVAPPTVGALLAALERASRFERALAADAQGAVDPWLCRRVAGAFFATALLGGDETRCYAAARDASLDGSPLGALATRHATPRQRRRAAGENAARALRHALMALREPASASPTPPSPGSSSGAADGPGPDDTAPLAHAASPDAPALARAAAAVYPPAQAQAILALFESGAALESLTVDDFVARLARN